MAVMVSLFALSVSLFVFGFEKERGCLGAYCCCQTLNVSQTLASFNRAGNCVAEEGGPRGLSDIQHLQPQELLYTRTEI